eukprot:TRINITY_DN8568_c3_g1_i1.p2 TRINITY_DN8568_c3_g1~~TRINITY_DN8568_c3_g1_i1.p2  ORF type:complete len:543 (+),score=100.17 TRINITY_DN8568_c3_g1_i1:83-1711(+)
MSDAGDGGGSRTSSRSRSRSRGSRSSRSIPSPSPNEEAEAPAPAPGAADTPQGEEQPEKGAADSDSYTDRGDSSPPASPPPPAAAAERAEADRSCPSSRRSSRRSSRGSSRRSSRASSRRSGTASEIASGPAEQSPGASPEQSPGKSPTTRPGRARSRTRTRSRSVSRKSVNQADRRKSAKSPKAGKRDPKRGSKAEKKKEGADEAEEAKKEGEPKEESAEAKEQTKPKKEDDSDTSDEEEGKKQPAVAAAAAQPAEEMPAGPPRRRWWNRLCPPPRKDAEPSVKGGFASPRSLRPGVIPDLESDDSFLAKIERAYQAHVGSIPAAVKPPPLLEPCKVCKKRVRVTSMEAHLEMCERRDERQRKLPPIHAREYECVAAHAWCRTYDEPSKVARKVGVIPQGRRVHVVQVRKLDGVVWGMVHGEGVWTVLRQGCEAFFAAQRKGELPPIASPSRRLYPGFDGPPPRFDDDVLSAARAATRGPTPPYHSAVPPSQGREDKGDLPRNLRRLYKEQPKEPPEVTAVAAPSPSPEPESESDPEEAED